MKYPNWALRVCSKEGDRATAFVRSRQFEVGLPVQFDDEYDGISALEYVLGAVAGDVVNGLTAHCRRKRIEVFEVEALVSGGIDDPLAHLGVVGATGNPGISSISIKVYVNSFEDEEKLRSVWAEVLERSPLATTFRHLLKLQLAVVG